ncbi:hypothetical protein SUGI_0626930 [Cryptomeria japonica]|nr:hypothetical protein SUGI_0626930 [Cryptomeria japonica]
MMANEAQKASEDQKAECEGCYLNGKTHQKVQDQLRINDDGYHNYEEVVDEKCVWEDHAIIARIVALKKPRQCITPWVEENWGRHIVVKLLPKGFFVAIFAKKEERDQALNLKNWFFDSHLLYTQPWTPNFDPLKLAIYDNPVWIRLFNLLIEYWGDPSLEKKWQITWNPFGD